MAKKLLRSLAAQGLAAVLELSATMQVLAHHTDDHAEALAALREKRDGNYRGS